MVMVGCTETLLKAFVLNHSLTITFVCLALGHCGGGPAIISTSRGLGFISISPRADECFTIGSLFTPLEKVHLY